jgi:hypothetical protein
LVSVGRVRSNRTFWTFYHRYIPADEETPERGRPTWYGAKFSLSDSETWSAPDETLSFGESSRRGKLYRIEIQAWHNMLMTGAYKPQRLAMHQYPFTLVHIVRYEPQGHCVSKRPLWLLVIGKRRHELTLRDIFQLYVCRFNLEHFFRFGKQKLLLK